MIRYLHAGSLVSFSQGTSWCRFRCGVPDAAMGSADLGDGTYVWPQGFAHYLEAHAVKPPDDFVAHALRASAPGR